MPKPNAAAKVAKAYLSRKIAFSIPVHAAFVYLSRTKHRGIDEACDAVQDLIERLKAGDPKAANTAAAALAKHPILRNFRGVIVPAPRSSARHSSLLAFAAALVRHGVGSRVEQAVIRTVPVESSRLRRQQGLPGVPETEHVKSMLVTKHGINPGEAVLIVDDIVTTGATIRAVAVKLRQAGHAGVIIGAAAGHFEADPSEAVSCPIHYVKR